MGIGRDYWRLPDFRANDLAENVLAAAGKDETGEQVLALL
jgi:hypothetical protein